jgi:hypothetical protein
MRVDGSIGYRKDESKSNVYAKSVAHPKIDTGSTMSKKILLQLL